VPTVEGNSDIESLNGDPNVFKIKSNKTQYLRIVTLKENENRGSRV